jgi:methionyl-tRNA formyltransferase
LERLGNREAEIVGLVLHPVERRAFGAEIREAAGVPEDRVFDASRLADPGVIEGIAALRPDLGLSILFGYILRREIIGLFPRGVVNLHPGLLPYNRGAFPNVWSLVDGTPAGVTLHFIDETIDGGEVISQRSVRKRPTDTGEALYHRLESESLELFCDTWPSLADGTARGTAQQGVGTFHQLSDVDAIDSIDLDRRVRAGDLIDILRARTFPPHKGAYFETEGRRVYMRLELIEGSAVAEEE